MNYILRRRGLGLTSCRAIAAASQVGITVHRSDRELLVAPGDKIIRWGCTSTINPNADLKIFNTAAAIHRVNDKAGFRRQLMDSAPSCIPQTWFDSGDIRYPAVMRPQYHAQGRNLHLIRSHDDFLVALRQCGPGWYASEFIDKVSEYRVYLVQGRVACVASKQPIPGQVAWNHAQGGHFENVRWGNWPLEAIRQSFTAFKESGLDFGGVDVMCDRAGRAYVIEINSAPSLTSEYRQQCMAKAFDWMLQGMEVQEISGPNTYRDVIHPAIRGEE